MLEMPVRFCGIVNFVSGFNLKFESESQFPCMFVSSWRTNLDCESQLLFI